MLKKNNVHPNLRNVCHVLWVCSHCFEKEKKLHLNLRDVCHVLSVSSLCLKKEKIQPNLQDVCQTCIVSTVAMVSNLIKHIYTLKLGMRPMHVTTYINQYLLMVWKRKKKPNLEGIQISIWNKVNTVTLKGYRTVVKEKNTYTH